MEWSGGQAEDSDLRRNGGDFTRYDSESDE
jgi:hypothetical protein